MAKYIVQENISKRFIADNKKTKDKSHAKIFNSKEEAIEFITPIYNKEMLKHYTIYKIKINIDSRVTWY